MAPFPDSYDLRQHVLSLFFTSRRFFLVLEEIKKNLNTYVVQHERQQLKQEQQKQEKNQHQQQKQGQPQHQQQQQGQQQGQRQQEQQQ